jgi:predicted Zn-dependent peptidase
MRLKIFLLFLVLPLVAQQVPVQEVVLDNGLKLLMIPRKGSPTVTAGWVAKVGSVNEYLGITGISHLFEHMMFKGTHTIGTKNIEEDLKLNLEQDRVKAELRKEEQDLARRLRLGEIADAKDPQVRTPRHRELLARFEELVKKQRAIVVKEELDQIYQGQGGTGINAGTSEDWTIYFLTLPANKLELWFWMESDRLLNPVFREFYAERDVVKEERRLSLDSTPTGRYREQFNALFWKSSPYGWQVVGWPSDLDAITREDAADYYARYYAPNNLAACLVGDFDTGSAVALAKRYFGRLRHGPRDPEPVRTAESPQMAEQRMTGQAETSPEVTIRYHSVADGHKDEPALEILAGLLNDRTGRLYKSLVLDRQVATSARAGQDGNKYEGYFEFHGTAKQGHTPEEVEQAIYGEIDKLKNDPVSARELQKVKNQVAAALFRRLQSDYMLMMQVLIAEGSRGWRSVNTDPPRLEAVTAEDVRRVAAKYFEPVNRNVMILYRKPAAGGAK